MRPAQPAALHQRFTPAPTPTRIALAAAMAIALAAGITPLAHAQSGAAAAAATPIAVNIPAQPLGQALNELARQANLQMTFPAALVAGKQAPTVSGQFTVRQALDRLLSSSGLAATVTGNAAVVREAPSPRTVEATLPAVIVTAAEESETGYAGAPKGVVVRRSSGTALFGEGDLREVPFSVNVVGSTEIKNRQASTFSEALATDPAITTTFGADDGHIFEAFQVRGFPVTNSIYDGHLIEAYYTSRSPETTDKVEVLRGAAAFRYGFIQPGGSVNFVSKQPTNEPFTSLTLSATDFGRVGAHLDTGGRLGEDKRFGYRINAVASGGDVYFDNAKKDRQVLAIATDFKITPTATAYFGYEYANVHGKGGGMDGYRQIPSANGRLPDPIPDPRNQWLPSWGYGKALEQMAYARLKWELAPNWTLDTALRYTSKDEEVWGGAAFAGWQPNGDHPLDYYGYLWEPRTLSNTTYLQGVFNSGGVKHKLTTGLSYTKIDVSFVTASNAYSLTVPSNLYAPATLPYAAPLWDYANSVHPSTKQMGFFVSDQMDIGRWHPLIGVRWSKIETGVDTWNPLPGKNQKVTPMLGLSYDLSDAVSLYGSYAAGLENGGRAPAGTANAGQQMGPLDTQSFELGFKTDLMNGEATVDAALFHIEKTAAFTNTANNFIQAGKQVHQGLELLAKGRFWKPVEISAGLQYIDAAFKDDPARDGQSPINIPKWRAVMQAEYTVGAVPGLFLTGLIDYTGKRELAVPNQQRDSAYTRLDLGVRYESKLGQQKAVWRLNVNNVTNKRYWSTVGWSGGTSAYAEFGAPRTVKGSLELQF